MRIARTAQHVQPTRILLASSLFLTSPLMSNIVTVDDDDFSQQVFYYDSPAGPTWSSLPLSDPDIVGTEMQVAAAANLSASFSFTGKS